MSETLTLTIPSTPPSALSQNESRFQHWGTRARIKNAWQKDAAAAAAVAKCNDGASLDPARRYVLDVVVYWEKGHRIVDDDNLIASFKFARDAIARVFGVDDKRFRTGGVFQLRDKQGAGYTRVVVTEEGA